jgi:hypothetical protein
MHEQKRLGVTFVNSSERICSIDSISAPGLTSPLRLVGILYFNGAAGPDGGIPHRLLVDILSHKILQQRVH